MLKNIAILAFLTANISFSYATYKQIHDSEVVRLENIKFQILSKLGLSSPPNISKHKIPPNVPPLREWLESKSLNRGPEKQTTPQIDDYQAKAKIERVISFAEPVPKNIRGDRPKCCYFRFSPKTSRMKVARARQWVYIRSAQQNRKKTAKINLYKYTVSTQHGTANRTHVASRNIKLVQGWHHFKVKKIVSDWIREPHTNIGFDVEVEDKNVTIVQPGQSDALQPFIEVYVKDRSDDRRFRREVRKCSPGTKQKNCCLYSLIVDFEKFNWNWIIAPKRFEANYCAGECPLFYNNKEIHAQLVGRMNRNIKFCCSSSQMSAINVLYVDQNSNVMLEKIPGIVANSCSCS